MVDFKKLAQHSRVKRENNIPAFMTVSQVRILSCIPSTEDATFGELCAALRKVNECPERGDTSGWRELFTTIDFLEDEGYVFVQREDGRIASIILTDDGANIIRGIADEGRELFKLFEREDRDD